jgi:hypothetical protein
VAQRVEGHLLSLNQSTATENWPPLLQLLAPAIVARHHAELGLGYQRSISLAREIL